MNTHISSKAKLTPMDSSLNRIDSWFGRISQGLARDKTSTADNKEDIRYAVRKINQCLYAGNSSSAWNRNALLFCFEEKPAVELIVKYANVIVDLLLSMNNYPDDFEFLGQILNIVREILDCDKSMCVWVFLRRAMRKGVSFFRNTPTAGEGVD